METKKILKPFFATVKSLLIQLPSSDCIGLFSLGPESRDLVVDGDTGDG
jgi:hypothetical protein